MSKGWVLALAGGVGGGKLARGLAASLPPDELAIVVNTADDFVHLGLHISPDIDSVLYALADLNDPERGWGLAGETWHFMDALGQLGGETWFRLGDRDLATHVFRTQQLAAGRRLSQVTELLLERLQIGHRVIPMTDAPVRTLIDTDEGTLPFQDYFVRRQCRPVFRGISFAGAAEADMSEGFRQVLAQATAIVITPSNPFISIGPILALNNATHALRNARAPVVAVSPIVGGKAVKGPLAKMMQECGLEVSPVGLARHYGALVDGWVIDTADNACATSIEALGCRVRVCNTMMYNVDDKTRLARETLDFAREIAADNTGRGARA